MDSSEREDFTKQQDYLDEGFESLRSSSISSEIPDTFFSEIYLNIGRDTDDPVKYDHTTDSESMATLVEQPPMADRVYVHQLNLTSADISRRQKEKEMVEEEKRKVDQMKEIKRRQKEEEKKRDMEMLVSYNPWGKPGGGARVDEVKRHKLEDDPGLPKETPFTDEEFGPSFNNMFGRPGNGAPNRTQSGRIKTQIVGDPSIRFQDTQLVRLSIENHLRYKNEDKENYRGNLDELVQEKLNLQEKEKQWEQRKLEEMREQYPFGKENKNGGSYLSHTDSLFMATIPRKPVTKREDFDPWGKGFGNPSRDNRGNVVRHKFAPSAEEGVSDVSSQGSEMTLGMGRVKGGDGAPHITESGHVRTRLQNTLQNINAIGPISQDVAPIQQSYHPWGKPGAGAPFVRENGRPFEEKMGWSLTGHPKKRTRDAKLEYKNALEKEINEKRERENDERFSLQNGGTELASVIRRSVGGRPKKNPVTGEIARNPRLMSDVTSQKLDIRRVKSQESLIYHNELTQQAAERQQMRQQQKEMERAQSEKHVSTWDSFWGRPGHGAPRDPENHKKENLNRMLLETKGGESYVKHYMSDVVPSKHKNRYEYPMKDTKEIEKKGYEFRTPWPSTED